MSKYELDLRRPETREADKRVTRDRWIVGLGSALTVVVPVLTLLLMLVSSFSGVEAAAAESKMLTLASGIQTAVVVPLVMFVAMASGLGIWFGATSGRRKRDQLAQGHKVKALPEARELAQQIYVLGERDPALAEVLRDAVWTIESEPENGTQLLDELQALKGSLGTDGGKREDASSRLKALNEVNELERGRRARAKQKA